MITDKPVEDEMFDLVKVLKKMTVLTGMETEQRIQGVQLSPFTHTIKLEADMLFTQNTDWWWNYLWQHDQVFSYHCRNYKMT